MKKVSFLMLNLILVFSALVSCGEKSKFEDISYREKGLYFVLPNTMQRGMSEDYDFYFYGRTIDVMFSALKITDSFLGKVGLEKGTTAEKYVDTIIERQELDKSKLYYKYYEDSNQYNFRYNYAGENGFEMFFYVTVTGNPENLWYIEMCCAAEESLDYLPMFENWRKTIGTYS